MTVRGRRRPNLVAIARAARRSGRLHRCIAVGRGLPAALAAFPPGQPASAIGGPGLELNVPGWSVREQRLSRSVSRYVFRRASVA